MVFPYSAGIPSSGFPFSKESVPFSAWGKHQANLVGCFVKACYNNNITDVWTAETDVVVCVGNCGVCSGVPAVMTRIVLTHQ